jgi:hypothetical protein
MVISMMTITVVSITAMPGSSRLDAGLCWAAFMGRLQWAGRVVFTITLALAPTRRPGTGSRMHTRTVNRLDLIPLVGLVFTISG